MLRRTFLRGMLASSAVMLFVPSRARGARTGPKSLAFDHTHTGEKLSIVYAAQGGYLPDAMQRVAQFLRDFRTGDAHAIDPELLDLLHAAHRVSGSRAPFQVISGYRSPQTNSWLRAQGRGVAGGSLHMVGKAIDVRLHDVRTARLREVALALRRGGVGFYPQADFVHLDTGPVRRW